MAALRPDVGMFSFSCKAAHYGWVRKRICEKCNLPLRRAPL